MSVRCVDVGRPANMSDDDYYGTLYLVTPRVHLAFSCRDRSARRSLDGLSNVRP